jgi:hypothetical protein
MAQSESNPLSPAEIERRINRLEALLADADRLTDRVRTLTEEHKSTLDGQVDSMLPDLEEETLANLRNAAPWFVTPQAERVFAAAAEVEVPLWKTLILGAVDHRKEALGREFDLLRMQLRAALPSHPGARESGGELERLSREIVEAQQRLAAIPPKEGMIAEIQRLLREYERLTGRPFRRGEDKAASSSDSSSGRDDRGSSDKSDGDSSWLDSLFGSRSGERRSGARDGSGTTTPREEVRLSGDFRTDERISAARPAGFTTDTAAAIALGAGIAASGSQSTQASETSMGDSASGDSDRGDLS